MDPLEEGWLSVELQMIASDLEDWSVGIKESFDSLDADSADCDEE